MHRTLKTWHLKSFYRASTNNNCSGTPPYTEYAIWINGALTIDTRGSGVDCFDSESDALDIAQELYLSGESSLLGQS